MALFSVEVVASSPAQIVEDAFIDAIAGKWDSFEVCEHRSRGENRAPFFATALDQEPNAIGKVIEAKDIVVRENSGDRGFHLGVVELEVPTMEVAERLQAPQLTGEKRFFAGTKILTRYVSLKKDRRVLVVYSETNTYAQVNHFLEEIGNLNDQLWVDR